MAFVRKAPHSSVFALATAQHAKVKGAVALPVSTDYSKAAHILYQIEEVLKANCQLARLDGS